MDEIRAQERLAAHEGKDTTAGAMQPVERTLRRIFGHSLDRVIEGPAVMAVEIALEFCEEIRDQRMKVAGCHTRADIGEEPALHCVIDLTGRPMPLVGRTPSTVRFNRAKKFGMLRKDRFRKPLRNSDGLKLGTFVGRLS
jgi:hypothetical protein